MGVWPQIVSLESVSMFSCLSQEQLGTLTNAAIAASVEEQVAI